MQTAEEMRQHLTEKAVADQAFRQQLLSDPKSVMFQEFGVSVPENIDIKVHESDMNVVHLALPPNNEMDEEQLEAISAGLCCCGI